MNAQAIIDPDNPDMDTLIDAVAWSPDGSLLAFGSGVYPGEGIEDYRVRVVNIATQQVIFSLPMIDRVQLIWSPSGDDLFIGSLVDGIQRYRVATGVLQGALAGRDARDWYDMTMSLSPDGSRIAAIFKLTGEYTEFTTYDGQSFQPVVSVDLPLTSQDNNWPTWIGYSPDGSLLATTGWDGIVRLWDADTLSQVAALSTTPGQRLYAGDWSADGHLAVGGQDRYITVWNVDTQQIVNRVDVGSVGYNLRWHSDGRQIATASGKVWDSLSGQQIQASAPNASQLFYSLDWSPSGVLAVGISIEGRLELLPNDNPLGSLASLTTVPALPTPTPSATPTSTATPSPTPSSGTFPATSVLDNFNRADGVIGGNWNVATVGYSIASNHLDVGSGGAIYWNPATFGADQEAFVTLTNLDSAADEMDLLLKHADIGQDYRLIEVWYQPAAGKVQVWTHDPAADWVQYGADIPVTFAAGDQFGARAKADGTVEVYKNGTLLASRDVSGWAYYADGGAIGLWMINASDALLDDFGGGDVP
ncbi:MAG: hypothetical protein ABI690_31605 [Chloroflexota bacterium]